MKKIAVIFLALVLVSAVAFAACSKSDDDDVTTTTGEAESDLSAQTDEYGFETEDVTDENGEKVTDENGDTVTTQVAVIYKKTTDKNGNEKVYAQKLDDDGNEVTDKKGNPVTVKSDNTTTTKKSSKTTSADSASTVTAKQTTTEKATATTKKNVDLTKQADTTKFEGKEKVPKTSATGDEVNFSSSDQEIIASMLEVPYLYLSSYENSDGVPINIATYTAVWMAQHEGGTSTYYAASPVCLNLFKFYGQTVVNFKTKCNDVDDTPIKYLSNKDQFQVIKYNDKKQTVKISKIEDLGDNNFYKVTASVSGAGKISKVVAVVQKNKLDTSLGFSIKALKWS